MCRIQTFTYTNTNAFTLGGGVSIYQSLDVNSQSIQCKFQVLPEDPETLLENGKYHQVPIIIGYNSDEGILNLAAYLQGNIQFEEVDKVRSNVFSIIKDK